MTAPRLWLQRLSYFLIIGSLYLGAVGFMGYVGLTAYQAQTAARTPAATATQTVQTASDETPPSAPAVLSGKPVRLVVSDAGIDLPVDEGYYDQATDSWTLSDTRLQHAAITVPANNQAGNTLIYGHGTDQVLAPLSNSPPSVGAVAQVYTDNGRVFTYTFRSSHNYTPNDTSIFSYSGPPILTVQTCTGPASEWRTMYTFDFKEVTQA